MISLKPRKRNPYRHFLRNVYVRRTYSILVLPVWLLLLFPVLAWQGIRDGFSDAVFDVIKTIKDGNSYD